MNKLALHLQDSRILRTPRIINCFRNLDRRLFVPTDFQPIAMQDRPLPIGKNSTISAPHMHAIVVEHLDYFLTPGASVLDVGCGSGFLSCLFADLVGNGLVVGIDIDLELIRQCIKNSAKIQRMRLKIIDGTLVYMQGDAKTMFGDDDLRFDAIHVGADAKYVPENLIRALKVGGCLIIPVNGVLKKIVRADSRNYYENDLSSVFFVPLQ